MIWVVLLWFTAWALSRVVTDASAVKIIVLVCWAVALIITLFNGGYLHAG